MRVAYEDYYICDARIQGFPCGTRIEFLDVDGEPGSDGVMAGGPSRKGEDGAIRCLGCDEDFCKYHAAGGTGYCLDCHAAREARQQLAANRVFCGALVAIASLSSLLLYSGAVR
jgi:hypothetical protein